MGTETQESEGAEHHAPKKKESILLLTSLWDACESWFKVIMTAATHKKAIVEDNKGGSAVTSTTFLLVSILGVNVYAILFHGWVTMVTWPRRLPGRRVVCARLMFIYVNVC